MNSFYFMLQKIRKNPKVYIGKKSLTVLEQFWNGYSRRESIEVWEKSTGCTLTENYKDYECFDGSNYMESMSFVGEFDKFVFSYYNSGILTCRGASLISENSNSEEEAFDKFFELLDEFMAQKKRNSQKNDSD